VRLVLEMLETLRSEILTRETHVRDVRDLRSGMQTREAHVRDVRDAEI